ncbi:TetR/AcrR family transcriptional regulator [Streptomyces sp. G7(2002)]|uniref:TetR/AcrR family transcriptional regulator n=1 Tax=Streptomyces sp. G7(2002) TaxID=2971798 RepID=UPI00237E320A|nr:TetR family transcriptional regulator [Streptomyces sp. G7(2002)]WDT59673.1 TetR family transcriptional regulator [Streptomyces sp. G7(2002)]
MTCADAVTNAPGQAVHAPGQAAQRKVGPGGPAEDAALPERKGERTRRRILTAARRKFAEVGYERATIRAIATEAEVDKSSVIQYFGSKQDLFREAVHWQIPHDELTTSDPGQTVENRLRSMLDTWAADPDSPMAVLLRTSMTSDEAAELLRRHLTVQVTDHIAATIDAPDARLRAALFSAIMMGLAAQRHLLHLPDLAEADVEDIVRIATPLLRSLIAPEM